VVNTNSDSGFSLPVTFDEAQCPGSSTIRPSSEVMNGVMKYDTELLSSSVTTRCFDGD
jgi:hypothetical protein